MNQAAIYNTSDPNSWRAILAMTVLGIVGSNMVLILPVVVGALIDILGLTSRQAGFMATAEFIGMAAGNLVIASLIHSWNRRSLGFLMLLLMIAGNITSVFADGFAALFITRTICGLSEGALVALMTAVVVSTRAPERIFASFSIANLIIAAISFKIIPGIIAAWGTNGAFVWLAGLACLGMSVLHWLPAFAVQPVESGPDAKAIKSRIALVPAIMGLAAMFSFSLAIGAVWPYMERIGVSQGLSVENVASWLAAGSFAAIAGALMVTWLGTRLGRTLPVSFGSMALAACLLLLIYASNVFVIVVLVFMWAWVVTLSYLTGAMALLDPLGRVASIGVAMQSSGLMVGPALSAMIISGDQYIKVGWVGIICALVCVVLIVPIVLPADLKMREKI